jgi:hypothetical protein
MNTTAPSEPHPWLDPLVRGALLVTALLAFGNLALTIAARLPFPYPLEWMETTSLAHARRLFAGEPLYVAPSGAFIPYLYPPLGYLPFGLSTAWLGPTLPVARLGSLACLVVTLVCVGRASTRLGGSLLAGLVGAAIFALGFGYTGAFLDLVRIDGCFVMLLAVGVERVLAGKERSALGLFAASVLAKQHGLLFLGALCAVLLWDDARRKWPRVLIATCSLCLIWLALTLGSQGEFLRYTFELPASHGLQPGLLVSFVLVDLGVYLPVLSVAVILAVRRGLFKPSVLALLLAAVAASALGRAHPGGDDNVRLPALLLLSITGAGTLVPAILDAARGAGARLLHLAVLLLQLTMLAQPPSAHAPTPAMAQTFVVLQRALLRCADGGSTAALDHPLLGSRELAHTMALSDLRMGTAHALAAQGTRAVLALLDAEDAPEALAVGEHFPALDAILARRYEVCERVPAPRLATGYLPADRSRGRPEQVVYRKRPRAQ